MELLRFAYEEAKVNDNLRSAGMAKFILGRVIDGDGRIRIKAMEITVDSTVLRVWQKVEWGYVEVTGLGEKHPGIHLKIVAEADGCAGVADEFTVRKGWHSHAAIEMIAVRLRDVKRRLRNQQRALRRRSNQGQTSRHRTKPEPFSKGENQ